MKKFSVNQRVVIGNVSGWNRWDWSLTKPVYGTIISIAYHVGNDTIFKVQSEGDNSIREISSKRLFELNP